MKKKTFVGGRGCKAPYKSSVVRVPDPLVPAVEEIVRLYREQAAEGNIESDAAVTGILLKSFIDLGVSESLIEKSKKILEKKGTRKNALKKLLQVILNRRVSEEELEN